MTGTSLRRWGLPALMCVALLTAGCGGDGGDNGPDAAGDPDESTYEISTAEEFSIAANTLCNESLTVPITEDPGSYADVADELESMPVPEGDDNASELVAAMRSFVTAYDEVVSRVQEIPDFESPPGTWLLAGNGTILVSPTGAAADVVDSGIPPEVGLEYLDAREALSDAAWSAEAPGCEAVVAE